MHKAVPGSSQGQLRCVGRATGAAGRGWHQASPPCLGALNIHSVRVFPLQFRACSLCRHGEAEGWGGPGHGSSAAGVQEGCTGCRPAPAVPGWERSNGQRRILARSGELLLSELQAVQPKSDTVPVPQPAPRSVHCSPASAAGPAEPLGDAPVPSSHVLPGAGVPHGVRPPHPSVFARGFAVFCHGAREGGV